MHPMEMMVMMKLLPVLCAVVPSVTFWLVEAEVVKVDSFKNTQCKEFFYKDKEPSGIEDSSYTRICQHYRGQAYFASLYDKSRRIPLYSASKFKFSITNEKCKKGKIDSKWKYEPQLADPSKHGDMLDIDDNVKKDTKIKESQPVEIEYYNHTYYNTKYTRVYLTPPEYQTSTCSQSATYTLTNAPPIPADFETTWADIIKGIKMELNESCYLVHGAIPYKEGKWIPDKKHERVAVPELIWMAYCCPGIQKVFLGHSDGEETINFEVANKTLKLKRREVIEILLPELTAILQTNLNFMVGIFKNDCKKSEGWV
ncbi:endonuclease domain-containing 1 protein-like [Erpetoichthys calabaricus]|uniref:endonuclease domain-containing 1 protein-like n=1 Tax=Erpetoichthys calabaricus TaxID=27687 RepID=UPI002234498E|nr:endonuclease domain-containing 1 protein-like [Erpetoichthys calabaricus]